MIGGKRKSVPIVMIVGCCYMTTGQYFTIAGANFPVFRILLIVGIIRVLVRGEKLSGGMNAIDRAIIVMCCWVLFTSIFHEWEAGSGPKYVIGEVLSIAGSYFIFRIFLSSTDEVISFMGWTCALLGPVALEMAYEKVANRNLFAFFGGVPEVPEFRADKIRAQGTFPHSILAGTIGAICFPFAVAIWHQHRKKALVGGLACLVMIVASASSGPILSLLFGIFALMMWRYRKHCRLLFWGAVGMYLLANVLMTRPAYYLISKIDLTGGSTSYYRAYLIEQSIAHLDEWWLFGTDRTRHWMPSWQPGINEKHCDITSTYIAAGVMGGLPYMFLMINAMRLAFLRIGLTTKPERGDGAQLFQYWCLGSSLFSIVASGFSVSFFGQTQVFLWLPIAAIASIPLFGTRTQDSNPPLDQLSEYFQAET